MIIALAFSFGLALGGLALRHVMRVRLAVSRAAAERRVGEAREQVAALEANNRRELAETERELDSEAAEELTGEQDLLDSNSAEIDEREAVLQQREQDVAELTLEVRQRERQAQENREEIKRLVREREQALRQRRVRLEELGELTAEEAVEQLVDETRQRVEHLGQMQLRLQEERLKEEAALEARRIMATVIDRYNGVGHLDRVQNSVALPERRTYEAFANPDSPTYAAFAAETGCTLVADADDQSLTVRGDDPLGREVARRVLRQAANRSLTSPERLRQVAASVKVELDREVQNAGRKTLRQLELQPAHPEVQNLVGRLKYRLSYSQNQLKHAIEVATLSGMMAEELGLDVRVARRAGVLHDIGKALTHEKEGSHAVLGAEVARRCGEDEVVANAIGSHHNDEPLRSPIAYLVTAADAISGARPGARRESVTQYISRMQEIQEIAMRPPAVRRVDVMHAGREVRVIVAGQARGVVDEMDKPNGPVLADSELFPLAQQIARALEEELQFAGQIKVTVIRESRAVSVAS